LRIFQFGKKVEGSPVWVSVSPCMARVQATAIHGGVIISGAGLGYDYTVKFQPLGHVGTADGDPGGKDGTGGIE